MVDPLGTAQVAFEIAKAIYDQVQLAKANRHQCQTLGGRIRVVMDTLDGWMPAMRQEAQLRQGMALNASPGASPAKGQPAIRGAVAKQSLPIAMAKSPSGSLQSKYHTPRFQSALDNLQGCLNDCLLYVQKFSNQSSWFKQVLKAGTDEEKFAELNRRLGDSVNQLSLGIQVQQLIDHDKDKQDQVKDSQEILAKQDEIISLNKSSLAAIQALHLQQSEQNLLLNNQVESMKQFMMQLVNQQGRKEKPLIKQSILVRYFDIMFDQVIGKGSFGTIYLGKWFEQPVAVKTVSGLLDEENKKQFIHEVRTMSRLRCNTITQLYGACLEPGRAFLLMEYMENGSLFDAIGKQYHNITPERQQRLALDIARGLFYLHSQGVLHRDLKSANVLLNSDWHGKLTDFGLSKVSQAHSLGTMVFEDQDNSLAWRAPEVLEGRQYYTTASDIYSFGVILWELFTGKRPYANMDKEALTNHIINGKREVIPASIPDVYVNIIRRCWEARPANRPNLAEVIQAIEAYQAKPASPTPERLFEEGVNFEKAKAYDKAFTCYDRAAQKGYARAKTNLSTFFLQGTGGVRQDKQRAYNLLLEAAKDGHVRAMGNLAVMLEKGDGIPQDQSQALYWYDKAANSGDDWAKSRYSTLTSRGASMLK